MSNKQEWQKLGKQWDGIYNSYARAAAGRSGTDGVTAGAVNEALGLIAETRATGQRILSNTTPPAGLLGGQGPGTINSEFILVHAVMKPKEIADMLRYECRYGQIPL